ncbi:nSTAND1 domain-containing NTPase [Nonomuraea endophytica]|uniref:WD40 repeat protein/transcriptional regulator with XRE-family HTH domain n=1 Tax=Nonomuraea endophytica TaxID=714136 RepID=A0A7W8ENA6_9ACTN|nr:helix-turn-helix domain-containing protein [Nonomuraea endophytica]MBB5085238.1 WD40 repeat protein/transcriptional regulator with XRE-family HTH domain [Nonomuraea endophytica]
MDGRRQETTAFGAELRRWRTLRGLSLTTLAELVHYSKGYLSKIENGAKRPTPELARACDQALEAKGALVRLAPPKTGGGDECPYPGLDAFGPGSAHWFFGREEATAELTMRLAARMDGGGPLVVVAPSGAGKSSLLGAGLVPALARGALPRAGSSEWPVALFTPTARPMARLAEILGLEGRLVLVADQFEEAFTLCRDDAERDLFIRTLNELAVSGRALVVLGLRADYYGHVLAHPELVAALRGGQLALAPLTERQLRAAITEPAKAVGLSLEPGLADLLLRDGLPRDGGEPGTLPLLAHALRALWQQRENGVLTVAGYHRTGGIHGAVATTAEDLYTGLDDAAREVARRLLLRLVQLDPDGGQTRRRVPLGLISPAWRPVLDALVGARLLTADESEVAIAHEALLGAWPRLRDWIETDRAGLQTRRRLGEAAQEWRQAGDDASFTYRGASLAVAREWAAAHPDELGPLEAEFVRAGEHEERRAARKLRRLVAARTALVVVTAMTAGVVVWQVGDARAERDETLSRQVAAVAGSVRPGNAPLAAGLALAAWQRAETPESLGALIGSSGFPAGSRSRAGSGRVTVMAASADGATVVTGDSVGEVWLRRTADSAGATSDSAGATSDSAGEAWPSRTGDSAVRLAWDLGRITAAAFRQDGRVVAVGGEKGVRVWRVGNPTPIATHAASDVAFLGFDGEAVVAGSHEETLTWKNATPERAKRTDRLVGLTPDGPIGTDRQGTLFALSPDHATIAAADGNRLWLVERESGRAKELPTTGGFIYSLAFSPDGRQVAAGTSAPGVRLWSTADGTLLTDLPHPAEVRALAYGGRDLLAGVADGEVFRWAMPLPAPRAHSDEVLAVTSDERVMATGGGDGGVGLWTLDGAPLGTATEHDGQVNNLVLAGGLLASASDDDTVGVWDVTRPGGPRLLGRFTGHDTDVVGAALSQDGRIGASVCENGQVLLWDPATRKQLGRLPGVDGVTDVILREDLLAVGDAENNVQIWDVGHPDAPKRVRVLKGHTGYSDDLDWHPGGRYLASAGHDGAALVWDLSRTEDTPVARLTGHTGIVKNVSFDAASERLATIGTDGTLRVWDDQHRLHAVWQTVGAALRFLPGGRLVSGDHDGLLHRWTLAPEPVAARICALDPTPVSAREWSRHVSEGSYAPVCPERD